MRDVLHLLSTILYMLYELNKSIFNDRMCERLSKSIDNSIYKNFNLKLAKSQSFLHRFLCNKREHEQCKKDHSF